MRRMWKFTKCSAWCRVTVGSDTPRLLFCGSAFLAFTRPRIFLFPATSSFGSSSRARRLTTRNDIHPVQINPNMLTLRFLWTRMDEARQDIPSTLCHHFGISLFFFFLGVIFEMSLGDTRRNFEQLRNYVTFGKFAKKKKKKKKRTRATGDSEFTSQYALSITLILSYLYN